jgi:exodeoxyribonuclease VII large subunit
MRGSDSRSSSIQDLPLFASQSDGGSQRKHLTVTELTQQIKGALEPQFREVWLKGEVSNFRPNSTGHLYFSLKDQGSSISVAFFGGGGAGGKKRLPFELRDGLEILVRGKVAVYVPRGQYQFVADQMEPLGSGALQVAFEQLKAKLSEEGLFDPARKRQVPRFPRKVTLITSPTGAAVRDMIHIFGRRAPQVELLVIPAVVQGDDAPRHLIRAIEAANRHRLGEVLIVGRGGGSIEDLWCFNDEGLARAIARSQIPVISAVGHEIDFTIADFVADLRAATPSAAAEILSSGWFESSRRVKELSDRLKFSLLRDLQSKGRFLQQIAARVVSPRDRLRDQMQRCDELMMRLERAIEVRLERKKSLVVQAMGKLDALSPLRVLERGFSIVLQKTGPGLSDRKLIRSAADLKDPQMMKQDLVIRFHDGEAAVRPV